MGPRLVHVQAAFHYQINQFFHLGEFVQIRFSGLDSLQIGLAVVSLFAQGGQEAGGRGIEGSLQAQPVRHAAQGLFQGGSAHAEGLEGPAQGQHECNLGMGAEVLIGECG
jgi:hypothetical protein